MYYSTDYPSPIGLLTLACNGDKLVGLWIEGQKYHGESIPEVMIEKDDIPLFDTVKNWLNRYFTDEKPHIAELPLAPAGSEFRKEVWKILCEIPYGKVITYGQIAQKIAAAKKVESMSAQAVGGAVGHNPISIIIPCHRVMGANGNMTGYAAGIAVKTKLLELECADIPKLSR